jgi:hypothetical protein
MHVLEVFHVPALIGCHGNGIGILLNGTFHHLLYRTVVTQMNHLGAAALDDAAHDIDGGVVAVEQACRCHNADLILERVGLGIVHAGAKIAHARRNLLSFPDRDKDDFT